MENNKEEKCRQCRRPKYQHGFPVTGCVYFPPYPTPPTTNQSEEIKIEKHCPYYNPDCPKCHPKPRPNVSGILERFDRECPLAVKYKQKGEKIIDFDYMNEQREGVKDFILKHFTELLEQVIAEIPDIENFEYNKKYTINRINLKKELRAKYLAVDKINQNLEEKLK